EYFVAGPTPGSLGTLGELVDECGVNSCVHNQWSGGDREKTDTIAAAIKIHSAEIACCVGTDHFLWSRDYPACGADVFGPSACGVHFKGVMGAMKFTFVGEGDLRSVDMFNAPLRLNYGCGLNPEYEESPKAAMAGTRACLKFTREFIAT